MTDAILLYLIFLIFLTILGIIGYLKIPVLCFLVLIISVVVFVASLDAFGTIWIIPLSLVLINVVLSVLALARGLG